MYVCNDCQSAFYLDNELHMNNVTVHNCISAMDQEVDDFSGNEKQGVNQNSTH